MNIEVEKYLQSILSAVRTIQNANIKGELNGTLGSAIVSDLKRVDNDIDDITESLES